MIINTIVFEKFEGISEGQHMIGALLLEDDLLFMLEQYFGDLALQQANNLISFQRYKEAMFLYAHYKRMMNIIGNLYFQFCGSRLSENYRWQEIDNDWNRILEIIR